MSKKNFKGGLDSLLGDQANLPKRGRPKTSTKQISKSSQEGTLDNEIRATFIVNEQLLDQIKAIAYWDRKLIKTVVDNAFNEYVDKYKKKNGEIKPAPKK